MTTIIGHRGARGLAPENTLASIDAAIALGVDGIEIDIRVTSDGVPVLVHDPQIVQDDGTSLVIAETTLKNLRAVKPDLPTLEEALRHVNQRTPVMIEVKPHVNTGSVVEVLQQLLDENWDAQQLVLGSKSQKTLWALHKALPQLPTTVIEAWSGLHAVWRARQLGTKRITMNYKFMWSGFIASMHHRGYNLYVYTLNDPKKAQRWERFGLAGVITDRPDNFLHKEQA